MENNRPTDLQGTILKNLISNEQYARQIIPFVKAEYFETDYRLIFKTLAQYVAKYNALPTENAVKLELAQSTGERYLNLADQIFDITAEEQNKCEWLIDQTEKWCQDQAIYLAVMESIAILDDSKTEKTDKNSIPDILRNALSVSFDQSIGHHYIADASKRYQRYRTVDRKVKFDIDILNKITGGGLTGKTLNIVLAGTGVGKSLFMTHCAAANLVQGYDVLYITLEMAEEKIAERIDANLMDIPIGQIRNLPENIFNSGIAKITQKIKDSQLVIKEFPTGAASVNDFHHLLNELELKRKFTPDIIYLDYLNLCQSMRVNNPAGSIGTYLVVKSIAEEIRGLAVQRNIPVMTATQVNRGGIGSSDIDMEDISDSIGTVMTADLLIALITTEALDDLNQIMVKQIKNRYSDITNYRKFPITIDRTRMKLGNAKFSNKPTAINTGQPLQFS